MKKANEYTQKDVTATAYRIAFDYYRLLLNKPFGYARPDYRFNFWKEVRQKFDEIAKNVDFDRVKRLRRERVKGKYTAPGNVLQNPLYLDWKRNNMTVKADRLTDGYRNHWAKSEFDRKVLAILAKY